MQTFRFSTQEYRRNIQKRISSRKLLKRKVNLVRSGYDEGVSNVTIHGVPLMPLNNAKQQNEYQETFFQRHQA